MLNTPSSVLFFACSLTILIEVILEIEVILGLKVKKTIIIKGIVVCLIAMGLIFFQLKIVYIFFIITLVCSIMTKNTIDKDYMTPALVLGAMFLTIMSILVMVGIYEISSLLNV